MIIGNEIELNLRENIDIDICNPKLEKTKLQKRVTPLCTKSQKITLYKG